jgi:membrane-bound serine protease (ClpP class)
VHPVRAHRAARLAGLGGIVVLLLGLLTVAASATQGSGTVKSRVPAAPADAVAQGRPTVIDFVQVSGVIDPPTASYLRRQLEGAGSRGADLVVLQLDTPGGLDAPVAQLTSAVLRSQVPVVAWVSPSGARAASAGAAVALGANVVAMAPGSTLGPALPLNLAERGQDPADERTGAGATLLESAARARGRDAGAASRLASERNPLTVDEALGRGLADLEAGSPATLFQRLDGRTVEAGGRTVTLHTADYQLRFHKMSVMERLLHTAIRPEIAYFLLLFGLFGLIFEVYNPGVGAAALTGGICLGFSFYALSVLPTSWAGVALLVVAVALFLIEMHEAGLGIFTVAGLAAFVGGSVMLFSGADPALHLPWTAIAAGVACMLLFFISVMTAAIRSRASVPAPGSKNLTGVIGEARTDIAPDGQVFADGTLWKARTAGMAIPQGAKVTVLGVSGLLLIVEEAHAVSTPE